MMNTEMKLSIIRHGLV